MSAFPCSVEKIEKIQNDLAAWNALSEGVDSEDKIRQLIFSVAGFRTREALIGCLQLGASLVNLVPSQVYMPPAKVCRKDYDPTPNSAWMMDPCCNHNLQETMCCNPTGGEVERMVIQGVTS